MLKFLLTASLCFTIQALPQYIGKIPNGANVPGVRAIGHVNPNGGGQRNEFGLAFAVNNLAWTKALCEADSDGDGATNGQELGDPCCIWKVGTVPQVDTATHPGVKNTFTAAQLSALKCESTNATASLSLLSSKSTLVPTVLTNSSTSTPPSTFIPKPSVSSVAALTVAINAITMVVLLVILS
jgi:hypothetical protein